MKSVQEVLQKSGTFLESKGIRRARRLVEDLLSHVLSCRRLDLYMQFDRPLNEAELDPMRDGLKRLAKGEPIDYVIGEIPFFGCLIRVDKRALIPRPETELLVEHVARQLQGAASLWDVCTGSGCIGIALKKKFPHLAVALSDASDMALQLAEENRRCNNVDVEILKGDLLTPFKTRKTDILVCNPPYVSTEEYVALDPSVREFEPKEALWGGSDGLDFYRQIASDAPILLNPKGRLFLEIGASQGEAVKKVFQTSDWREGVLVQDWSGKDRFFFLEKQ